MNMNLLGILFFTVNAILPLLLLILLGYFLKHKKVITPEFVKIGNKLVFRVCLPVLLFLNVVEIESINEINMSMIWYALFIIVLLVILGFLSTLTVKDKKQKGVMMQCVFRSNFALIGVPLAELIGGSEGVQTAALLSIFSIPLYNVMAVIVLTSFVGESGKSAIIKQIKAIAKNPLIIGVVLGIIALIIKGYLPDSVLRIFSNELKFIPTTMKYVSRTATPIALIVLGGQFEFTKVKGYRRQIIIATLGRTMIAPLIGVGLAVVLTKLGVVAFSPAVFAAFIALFGTPVAVSSAIMAEEMKNDGQLAAQLVVWTSVLSVFTLFITIFICRLCGCV